MAYDPKCYELAEFFLGGAKYNERLRRELAQFLQDQAEEWITGELDRLCAELYPSEKIN